MFGCFLATYIFEDDITIAKFDEVNAALRAIKFIAQ